MVQKKRNVKFIVVLFVYCLLSTAYCAAQSNLRTKNIILNRDTVALDTLSIIPGTVSLKDSSGTIIDSSKYRIDYVNAQLIIHHPLGKYGAGLISYKVFPYFFSQKYQHKDLRRIQNNQYGEPYI